MRTCLSLKADLLKCRQCRNGRQGRRPCPGCEGRGFYIRDYSIYQDSPARSPRLAVASFQEKVIPVPRKRVSEAPERRALRMERMADGLCIYCGSPDLETDTRCVQCADDHRRRNRRALPLPSAL